MIRFRVLGIPVRVEPLFWLTLGLLGALNSGSGNTPQGILLILLFVLAGFVSILIHEMGHALTARRCGARVEIVLQAMGGYARYTSAGISRKQSIAITAAGPIYQILLGILSCALFILLLEPAHREKPMQHLSVARPDMIFLVWLTAISWIWAVFNLLPILPLDGGRILQALLGPQRIRMTLGVSVGTCALLALVSLALSQPFIAIFMAFFGYQSWQALKSMER